MQPDSHSWTSGAWAIGDRVGLRRHTKSHPEFTSLLCRYVQKLMPGFVFAAVACFSNLRADEHTDDNNALGSLNLIAPLSNFRNGQVMIHQQPTKFLQVADGPCLLDPSLPHSTCDWEGDRVVLVAYSPRNLSQLPAPQRSLLRDLGFNLGPEPASQPVTPPEVTEPTALPGRVVSEPAEPPNLLHDAHQISPSLNDCPNNEVPGSVLGQPRSLASECPVVFEIFAGSARLTSAFRTRGWTCCHGVDHEQKPNSTCDLLIADLTSSKGQALLWYWLKCPHLVGLWIAPCCGTASLARLIPRYDELGHLMSSPKPLRSFQHPDGLPNLQGPDLIRVRQANLCYEITADLCIWASANHIIAAVENPRDSLFWLTSAWRRAQHACELQVTFQQCAYGGRRPKWTRVSHNRPEFQALHRLCPGEICSRNHEPWGMLPNGQWATKQEAEYPVPLAKAISHVFARILESNPPSLHSEPSVAGIRAAVGPQPKASKVRPLVCEHREVVVLRAPGPLSVPVSPMSRLQTPWQPPLAECNNVILPAGAQLLRELPVG